MAEMPPFEQIIRMPVVLTVPGMDAVEVERDRPYAPGDGDTKLGMDVYRVPGAAAPVPCVVLVHGGPLPRLGATNMGVFTSLGRVLAASGFVAVAFDHRFLGADRLLDAASDVERALSHVREHAAELGVDASRLAVWVFSGGGIFLSVALRLRAPWLRAALASYAALDLQDKAPGSTAEISDETRRALSPVAHLEGGPVPPLFVARAGLDHPFLNATIDRFVGKALAVNAEIDVLNHASGRHAFDILDDDARTKEILKHALEFLRLRLGG